jgi:hypothetical protein
MTGYAGGKDDFKEERMLKNGRTQRKTIDALITSFSRAVLGAFSKGNPHRVKLDAEL